MGKFARLLFVRKKNFTPRSARNEMVADSIWSGRHPKWIQLGGTAKTGFATQSDVCLFARGPFFSLLLWSAFALCALDGPHLMRIQRLSLHGFGAVASTSSRARAKDDKACNLRQVDFKEQSSPRAGLKAAG
mmetsp:Transcript_67011/g.139932  ORF Transcript_67011/g.139932 Transcript_67011/m.139932 type:complete len:132 (-) Transcript_67011:715-1110(-)